MSSVRPLAQLLVNNRLGDQLEQLSFRRLLPETVEL